MAYSVLFFEHNNVPRILFIIDKIETENFSQYFKLYEIIGGIICLDLKTFWGSYPELFFQLVLYPNLA
jgi:hypothetical protein